ncbi:MAG: LytTR family DNA-binding domain-containing protein [Bacteroidales bacterium]|jgi:two-component system LytT family response regulator
MVKDILTAVVIEDEQESLQLLKSLVTSNGNAKVIGATSNPEEAIDVIELHKPDIVFLDIKMPGKSGFDILDDLRKIKSVNPYIVFTTAYDEFAIRAFEYAAFDYLLKPVDPERLAATINRCEESLINGSEQKAEVLLDNYKKLLFRNISGIVIINPAEVVYIEAEGNYSSFRLSNGRTETVTVLLGKIERQLPADKFFRISRTYIINIDFLKKINSRKNKCILYTNGLEFGCEISHDKIKILLDLLKKTR